MKGDPIPETDHVCRYCKPRAVENGKPLVAAFELRENERDLSVNWVEYFRLTDREQAICEIRKAFRAKGFKIKASGRFAVLNVGEIKSTAKERTETDLQVLEWPENNDLSHSAIFFGHSADDLMIPQLLYELVVPENVYQGEETTP